MPICVYVCRGTRATETSAREKGGSLADGEARERREVSYFSERRAVLNQVATLLGDKQDTPNEVTPL